MEDCREALAGSACGARWVVAHPSKPASVADMESNRDTEVEPSSRRDCRTGGGGGLAAVSYVTICFESEAAAAVAAAELRNHGYEVSPDEDNPGARPARGVRLC